MRLLICLMACLVTIVMPSHAQKLDGAWEQVATGTRSTRVASEKYFAVAIYNIEEKKFIGTYGGSYSVAGNTVTELQEFNTLHPEFIGQKTTYSFTLKEGKLTATLKEGKTEWFKVDDGTPGKLAGAWLITGRKSGDQMSEITPGARKTMKILTGTRFQWIAYNAETKEFLGTGGGTYITENGKYTEEILFFSRDNSRVGASLTFDYSLEDGRWRHKGLSSKGDPIDEVWTMREKLGL